MVFEVGAHFSIEEGLDDLALGGFGFVGAGAAATCVLDGEVERRGAGIVLGGGIAAEFEELLDGGGAAGTDGAVEWGGFVFVTGVEICAGVME